MIIKMIIISVVMLYIAYVSFGKSTALLSWTPFFCEIIDPLLVKVWKNCQLPIFVSFPAIKTVHN